MGTANKFIDIYGSPFWKTSEERSGKCRAENRNDRQEQSITPNRLSIPDTDEKAVQANIQGVEIHLVQQKNNMQNTTVPVLEGNKREEEPPHRPTLIRASLTSEGYNMQTIGAMCRPWIKTYMNS